LCFGTAGAVVVRAVGDAAGAGVVRVVPVEDEEDDPQPAASSTARTKPIARETFRMVFLEWIRMVSFFSVGRFTPN
jgi:hypothetical protein